MKRKIVIPVVLVLFGLMVAVWQYFEHQRFVDYSREALYNRARDISNTLAVVIRSQRLFGGMVMQARLELALWDLVQPEEIRSITLINTKGDVVAWAGQGVEETDPELLKEGVSWKGDTVAFVNLADLGVDQDREGPDSEPTLILTEEDTHRIFRPDRRPPPPPDFEEKNFDRGPDGPPGEMANATGEVNAASGFLHDATPPPPDERRGGRGEFRGGRPRFGRPPWMDEEEYKSLLGRAGLYGFRIEMYNNDYYAACERDLWMRGIICGFALIAMLGGLAAWRNVMKNSALQVRLVRASEMNAHLREMNLAAAGLAHETRNPLNIVRGLAQLISRKSSPGDEVHREAVQIAEEVDRVTAQLNEFINYSKPRDAKPAPVRLYNVVKDVERALHSDVEDKNITVTLQNLDRVIEADETLLRQVIFNLFMNSVQAVNEGGAIVIESVQRGAELELVIRDDGPGVPRESIDKIFRPYFTTREGGTGLGLSVVNQIVQAHGWDVRYEDARGGGACFRISPMKIVSLGE
ncbi:MAG: hypothetical protein GC154_14970 [bacterium]|nr:hypothetical protein [bacterium]